MTSVEINVQNEKIDKEYEQDLAAFKMKIGVDESWDEADIDFLERCFSQTWIPKSITEEQIKEGKRRRQELGFE